MKTYTGTRNQQGNVVTADGLPLENWSGSQPHGWLTFNWGDSGPGASALAWSILVDALESEHLAHEYHDNFRLGVVAAWSGSAWTLTQGEVWRWVIKQCERCYDNVRRRGPRHIVV